MNNVFIFGAGASKEAGAPVMKDFLDKADEIFRINTNDNIFCEPFKDVFDSLAKLRTIYAKSYLDLDNIEILFGAIEMASFLEKLGDMSVDNLKKLRKSIVKVIVKTLENFINFPIKDGEINPPSNYDEFVKLLKDCVEGAQRKIVNKFSFISFNYDICLDYALDFHREKYDYGLTDNIPNDCYALIKLHGSINWGLCTTCNEISPLRVKRIKDFIDREIKSRGFYNYCISSSLNKNSHSSCNNCFDEIPAIVPPTWNKASYYNQIINVWKNAIKILNDAENIFIIGYSLPETDSFFRYLFALGIDSLKRIKSIWVFNPDETNVKPRFKELIGKGIENRFHFEAKKFSESIQTIKEILKGEKSYLN